MNHESFIETVIRSYSEQIREAFVECEHERGRVDFKKLNSVLAKLMKSAKAEGLSNKEFDDIVRSELSDSYSKLDYWQGAKKAA